MKTRRRGQQPFLCTLHFLLPLLPPFLLLLPDKELASVFWENQMSNVLGRCSFAYVISLGILTTMATFDMSLSYDRNDEDEGLQSYLPAFPLYWSVYLRLSLHLGLVV